MEQQARLAMFVTVLTVFFALLHITQGAKTTCEAPTVRDGSSANITCFFSEDVRLSKKNVKVLKTKFYSDTSESVVDCFWSDSQTFQCNEREGYLLQDHLVTNTAVVVIPKVSSRFEGTYMCEAVPSDPTDVQVCELRVDESNDGVNVQMELRELQKRLDDQGNMVVAVVVIAAAVLIVLVVVVVSVLICNRRRLQICQQQKVKKSAEKGNEAEHSQFIKAEDHSSYPDDIRVIIQHSVIASMVKMANADMYKDLIQNMKGLTEQAASTSPEQIATAVMKYSNEKKIKSGRSLDIDTDQFSSDSKVSQTSKM